MPQTYTVKQVAEILGYSTNSIYTFLKEKRIKGVRVGKGRFRIPPSELDRLLQTKKSVVPPQQLQPRPALAGVPIEQNGLGTVHPHVHPVVRLRGRTRIQIPTLFDWFVGTAAIITGIALFLFNQSFQGPNLPQFQPVINAARIILIAGGIGVLATAIIVGIAPFWHALFLGILASCGGFMAFLLFRNGDIDGSFVHGLLASVITLSLFIELSDMTLLGIFLALLAVAAPASILLGPTSPHIMRSLELFQLTPALGAIATGIASLVYITAAWWAMTKSRPLLWAITWFSALVILAVAFFYAQQSYWSRAMFFVVLSLATAIMPVWQSLRKSHARQTQLAVLGVFGGVLGFLFIAIILVDIIQTNARFQVERDLHTKALLGVSIVETTMTQAQNILTNAARNPQLLAAVKERDIGSLNLMSRLFYESNKALRRYVYLDSEGNGLALYPFGTFDVANYANRDYFIEAKRTGKPYVSGLFTALSDQSQRKIVVIAVPLLDEAGVFGGVIVGSVDFDHLGALLQKTTSGARSEFVTVSDDKGIYLVHPDPGVVGTEALKGNPLWRATAGEGGTILWIGPTGNERVAAYQPIQEAGWGLTVQSPLASAFKIATGANIMLFVIIVVTVIGAAGIFVFIQTKDRGSEPEEVDSS